MQEFLFKGAVKSGLKEEYVDKLRSQKTFVSPEWVLEERQKYPKPNELREVTVEELQRHSKEEIW